MLSKLLPTPSDYPRDQVSILRRNLRMHLFDGSLYVLGMSLVSVQTILPIFIKEIGGNPSSIGSVQVLWMIGANIPSAFVALRLHRHVLFKGEMVKWGIVHRGMLLVCGIIALLIIGKISSVIVVPLFLALIFFIAAFGSLSGLPWFQVYTKTVPVKLRGRLMGIRQLLGSAAGVVGGSIVSFVLYAVVFPMNFAVLFFGAFVFTMISAYFLTSITERPSVVEEKEQHRFDIISEAKRIIRTNKNFRNFLFADAFILMSIAASSFYSVYAIEKFSLPSSYAGTFTAIVMVTNIIANIVFGILADSYGHKANMLAYACCSGMAAVLALLSPNILVYGLVFFFLACTAQVHVISRLPLVAEMCTEHERPLYVGITNTLTAPTVFVGVLFGWLVPQIGYGSIFIITAFLALSSFVILYSFVAEPRNSKM